MSKDLLINKLAFYYAQLKGFKVMRHYNLRNKCPKPNTWINLETMTFALRVVSAFFKILRKDDIFRWNKNDAQMMLTQGPAMSWRLWSWVYPAFAHMCTLHP